MQPYDWGSHRIIAELRGTPVPSPGPEAELWMGAHPSAPSGVTRDGRDTTLDLVIAADPAAELGADVAERFEGRLPYLLKVLAAEKALSIQVHPDRERARSGYRDEHERGVERRDRNYVDDWPKPEVLVALTEFEVLAGFRHRDDAVDLIGELGIPALAGVQAELSHGTGDDGVDLTRALEHLLTWPLAERAELFDAVSGACERLAAGDSRHRDTFAATCRIARDHPGDVGVVASLLLQHLVLAPGEAIFMPAGGLHAYLRGAGIEVLANSDNVLRAGLTHKHIDVAELLDLVEPTVEVPVLHPEHDARGITRYAAPVPEFLLYKVASRGDLLVPGAGPRVLLVVEGEVRLRGASGELAVPCGRSAFLPVTDADVVSTGEATYFVACPGEASA